MRTGNNKEFLRKYGKIIKQLLLDENPPPCPISGGECYYTDPPHPIPCEICQANIEQAKKREEATKNEKLLFVRTERKR